MGLMDTAGKAVKFEKIGDSFKGVVTRVEEDVASTDMKGNPTIEDRVHLVDGDGEDRTLYVNKGLLRRAIAEAVRTQGLPTLRPGDTLTVLHHQTQPSRTPGYAPAKDFQAKVTPGNGAVAPAQGTAPVAVTAPAASSPVSIDDI